MNNTMDLDKKQKTPSARGILILGILAGLFLIPSILGAASDAILSLLYVILGIMNFNLDTLLNIILPEGFWLIVTLLEIFLFLILGVICFSNRKPRWLVAPLGALTLTLGVKIIFPILNSYLHGFHFTIGNFFDLFCRNYSITLLPIVLLSVIALLNTTGKKASWKKVAGILPPLVFVFSNLLCLVFIIVFFNRYRHLLELSQFLGNLGTFRYLCNRIYIRPHRVLRQMPPRLHHSI